MTSTVSDELRDRATDDAIAEFERRFSELFAKVKASMRSRAERVHPQLQPFGYHVLSAVIRSGPQHAGRMADRFLVDKSAMSRTISGLERLGLISREVDPADKRAFFVVATDEGTRRFDAVSEGDRELLRERLRGWDAREVERLSDLLGKLNDTLDSEQSSL